MIISGSPITPNEIRELGQALLDWDNEGGAIIQMSAMAQQTDINRSSKYTTTSHKHERNGIYNH